MSSQRHNEPTPASVDDALLDAARESIVAVGWKRTTLTGVARRAGVSRMTIYRRWPDMQTLLGDLMTREFSGLSGLSGLSGPAGEGPVRAGVADGIANAVSALRDNVLFAKIVHVDPELLLPYLLDRRGRTQDALLGLTEAAVREGQADGSVREGDPVLLARSLLLATYGFLLSTPTMTDDLPDVADAVFDDELRLLVDGYLAP
jgi:AcrR family transcriptional regulator